MLDSCELFEEIGRGPGTTVYRGHDHERGRPVAVKVVDPAWWPESPRTERFWQDAQARTQVKDRGMVRVFAVERERGRIISELMRSCLRREADRGPLPPDLVRSVLSQGLRTLGALHQQRRLHGAIKPSNLLIDEDGLIKLADARGFALTTVGGLADDLPPPQTLDATCAGYGRAADLRPLGKAMAPELLSTSFGPVGPGLDLYCLGFTAIELLVGPDFDRLFPGVGPDPVDSELAWMRWHSAADRVLPDLRELIPTIPDDLARALTSMLRKHVGERPTRAADALTELVSGPTRVFGPGGGEARLEPPAADANRAVWGKVRTVAVDSPLPSCTPIRVGSGKEDGAVPRYSLEAARAALARPRNLVLCALALVGLMAISAAFPARRPGAVVVAPAEPGIVLITEPAAAKVEIDGIPATGSTPLVETLDPGRHHLVIRKEGYHPVVRVVTVDPGRTLVTVGPISLEPERIRLRVRTDPPGARIALGGVDRTAVSPGPLDVTPGRYTLSVDLPGYEPRTAAIDLKPGRREADLGPYRLSPRPRPTLVASDPPGATITVAGRATGQKTPAYLVLPIGPQEIELALDGHATAACRWDIPAGDGPFLPELVHLDARSVPPADRPKPVITGHTEPDEPYRRTFPDPPFAARPPIRSFPGQEPMRVLEVYGSHAAWVKAASGRAQLVRLRGLAPPTHDACARRAREFFTNLVLGKLVYLERDPSDPEYADLYRAEDGLFVNLEMASQGHARVRDVDPRLMGYFAEHQDRARIGGLGVWGECDMPECGTSHSKDYVLAVRRARDGQVVRRQAVNQKRRWLRNRALILDLMGSGWIGPDSLPDVLPRLLE